MNARSTQYRMAGDESLGIAYLRSVAALWRCALPVVVAGFAGALVDEWHHAGVSSWISLCLSQPLPLATAMCFQSRLLAMSYLAMIGVGAYQWIEAVLHSGSHGKSTLALGQGCCVAAMLLALVVCPKVLTVGSTGAADLLAMVCTDLLCAAAGVMLGATLLAASRVLRPALRPGALA